MIKYSKEWAKGVPNPPTKEDIPTITKREIWKLSLQKHSTPQGKEGTRIHYDLRLSPPNSSKAYSFAIPKGLPSPSEKVLSVYQPLHTRDYMDWEGNIPKGEYGAGKVELVMNEPVEVLRSSPDRLIFNSYSSYRPQEYALIKLKDDNWIIINRTTTKKSKSMENISLARPKFKSTKFEDLDINTSHVMLEKKDGAFTNIVITKKPKPDLRSFSYRTSKRTGDLIEYTHKIKSLMFSRPDADLKGTVLQAELMARKDNKFAPANSIGAILNSNVFESRKKQESLGEIEPHAFNITRYKNKDVSNLSFEDKRKLLEEVVRKIPAIKLIDVAKTPKEKSKLIRQIIAKKGEGVVLVDPIYPSHMIKSKLIDDYDVVIKGFTKGTGKLKETGIGAIQYAHEDNPQVVVGKVGTGLNDALRRDMYEHPEKYIGNIAKVQALGLYKRNNKKGALRAPSFKSMHWEKNQ